MLNVFNVSPRLPFLDVLASFVIHTANEKGGNIADDIILLPTRRACRELKEIFLKQCGKQAVLLPVILPLGDVDENGLAFLDYENDKLDVQSLPPAISNIERNLLLANLVYKKMEQEGQKNVSEEQAYSLAVDLARLMDTVEMEELNFSDLQKIVPEKYSVHWQETLKFLTIITEEYPKILSKFNLMNPVARKIKLIDKQIEFWQKFPVKGRIFAGGSTGSLVPIARMLRFIAGLDNGYLILPGLDKHISEKDFRILISSSYPDIHQHHPQYGLLKLVDSLKLKISDVPELPLYAEYDVANRDRELLSSHIMLLPDMTDDWRNLSEIKDDVLDGVSQIVADNESDEVFAVASVLRFAVAENKKALLITPDRKIAKSVANELKRWDIIVDDSAGRPASDTVTGNYLILVLKMIYENFSPYSILAVLKHKYTRLGLDKVELDSLVRQFEISVLRRYVGVDDFESILSCAEGFPRVYELLLKLKSVCAEYINLMNDEAKYSIYDLLSLHLKLVENFVQADGVDVDDVLWSDDLHTELSVEIAGLLKDLLNIKNENISIDKMTAKAYFVFISNYFLSTSLRPTLGTHPNISIMNSIEARLMPADIYIMSGLNEDTFPSVTADDPWMSRPMKAEFKLPLPERKIGLASHDFVEFFCKKNVVMTRADKVDRVNTIESRWLKKLSAIITIAGINWKNLFGEKVAYWVKNFEAKNVGVRCKRPEPCPPICARPLELYATSVDKWYKDPYSVFAGKILKLNKLKDINRLAGASDLGNIIHTCLSEFKKKNLKTVQELLDLMMREALPYHNIPQIDFWYSKFRTVAEWFVEFEKNLNPKPVLSFMEEEGAWQILPNFTVKARADRIDILSNKLAYVYDYKTGIVPSRKSVVDGSSPQLLIEALILLNSGFDSIKVSALIGGVRYVKLTGSQNGKVITIDKGIDDILENAKNKIMEMVEKYYVDGVPYLSYPDTSIIDENTEKYADYFHLARVKEWN